MTLVVRAVRLLAIAALLAPVAACGDSSDATIVVDHSDSVVDTPVHVRINGLSPGQRVTVTAETANAEGAAWTAHATYAAAPTGTVDLATAMPQDGTYRMADPMGLFWSMRPAVNDTSFFSAPERGLVRITVSDGERRIVQRTIIRRHPGARLPTTALTVAKDGFTGMYHPATPAGASSGGGQPAGGGNPAVLVIGGSEGGDAIDLLGPYLAMHGYPTLSMAYFKSPGLPPTLSNIPLEYFGRALAYLSRQPGVDPHRIVVLGASRGGEPAALLGVHYPGYVRGVIALTSANVALCGLPDCRPAWTWHGAPVPFTRQGNEPNPTDQPAAVIPVERIAGPVLVVCAGHDEVWNSCDYGAAFVKRLDAHHSRYPHKLLTYPEAFHYVNMPIPYAPGTWDPNMDRNGPARAKEWPAILDFLAHVPTTAG